jgi:hypothetical protein
MPLEPGALLENSSRRPGEWEAAHQLPNCGLDDFKASGTSSFRLTLLAGLLQGLPALP